jgi:hypothetical protein
MQKFKTLLTVIGAVTILVLAANSAVFAATGGNFILGHKNKASKMSTLKRTTSGSALKLVTKSSSNAPLATNGHGKVANLNADMVDGMDSSALKTTSYIFKKDVTVPTDFVDIAVPLPVGTYILGYSFYNQGGGHDANMGGCYFYKTLPGPDFEYYGEERQLTVSGDSNGFSGAGAVTLAAGQTLNLYCYMPDNFTTYSGEPIQITATRTAVAGGGSLRLAPDARVAPKN